MLSEAADNSALEACPDSVQLPGSIRWGAAHFFEPIISLRPCLRGELRSMPRTTCPSGVAYHPGPRTRRTITSPGSRDGSWLPPDHAAGAKLRCLRLLRAIRCAISPANRSMGNDRSPANVQKTTFSCDRQHWKHRASSCRPISECKHVAGVAIDNLYFLRHVLPASYLPVFSKSFGCDYFSTTPKWLGISGIAGSVGSVGPSKCRAIKIAPGFRSIGACQLLLGQVRKRRSRQSFHPPEKQPQLTILADGVSIERRHFRVEF